MLPPIQFKRESLSQFFTALFYFRRVPPLLRRPALHLLLPRRPPLRHFRRQLLQPQTARHLHCVSVVFALFEGIRAQMPDEILDNLRSLRVRAPQPPLERGTTVVPGSWPVNVVGQGNAESSPVRAVVWELGLILYLLLISFSLSQQRSWKKSRFGLGIRLPRRSSSL